MLTLKELTVYDILGGETPDYEANGYIFAEDFAADLVDKTVKINKIDCNPYTNQEDSTFYYELVENISEILKQKHKKY
jgi:hypothetical protein